VNLQSADGDKYLQVTMSLEVEGDDQATAIKNNMPQVKSRIILFAVQQAG
jgi:flagellar basal body-associated protein FliL